MTGIDERTEELLGKVVVGLYPRHPYRGVPSPMRRRRLKVERIRCVESEPLDPMTVLLNPLLRRGRLLLTGVDMDTGQQRSFYLESFQQWEAVPYREEAERSKPTAAVAIDDGKSLRVVPCTVAQTAFCEAKRAIDPESVVYPISAAILDANESRRAV